ELRKVIEVEDIRQLTFVKAFDNIHNLKQRTPAGFAAWLGRIAEHTSQDELRKHRRRSRRIHGEPVARAKSDGPRSSVAKLLQLLAVHEETPSGEAAAREAARAVSVALTTLPPRQREAVTLVYLRQLSEEEVALRMGTTKTAVRSLLFRGLTNLRQALG